MRTLKKPVLFVSGTLLVLAAVSTWFVAGIASETKKEVVASEGAPAKQDPAADKDSAGPSGERGMKLGIVPGYRGTVLPLPGHQLSCIKEGDFVDVLATFEAVMKDNRKEMVTATILQNVRVLKVIRPGKLDETGAVQLLMNPTEAQYAALSVAQSKAINLLGRASGDNKMQPLEMSSFRKLFR